MSTGKIIVQDESPLGLHLAEWFRLGREQGCVSDGHTLLVRESLKTMTVTLTHYAPYGVNCEEISLVSAVRDRDPRVSVERWLQEIHQRGFEKLRDMERPWSLIQVCEWAA